MSRSALVFSSNCNVNENQRRHKDVFIRYYYSRKCCVCKEIGSKKYNNVLKTFYCITIYLKWLNSQTVKQEKQGLLNNVFYTSQLFQNMLCLQFISIPQKRIIQDQQRRLYNVLYTLSCANNDVLKTFVIRYKAFQKTSCVYK